MQKHVERLGNAGCGHRLALDDGFVGLGAAVDIIGLDGQDFLQDVGGAEGFERPNFHLAETLAAELRLTTQRLLSYQRVRAYGTGMHLVFDHMAEFEHVDDANGGGLVKTFAGAAIIKVGRSAEALPCQSSR